MARSCNNAHVHVPFILLAYTQLVHVSMLVLETRNKRSSRIRNKKLRSWLRSWFRTRRTFDHPGVEALRVTNAPTRYRQLHVIHSGLAGRAKKQQAAAGEGSAVSVTCTPSLCSSTQQSLIIKKRRRTNLVDSTGKGLESVQQTISRLGPVQLRQTLLQEGSTTVTRLMFLASPHPHPHTHTHRANERKARGSRVELAVVTRD